MADKTAICEICSHQQRKYKCPKCSILYCSLECYKQHQISICSTRIETAAITEVLERKPMPESSNGSSLENGQFDELGDRVDTSLLDKLCENERVKALLQNKHLRDYLIKLNSSENPTQDMEHAMREPIFLEFADACLQEVEPQESSS